METEKKLELAVNQLEKALLMLIDKDKLINKIRNKKHYSEEDVEKILNKIGYFEDEKANRSYLPQCFSFSDVCEIIVDFINHLNNNEIKEND
jgi:hypothetical protein